MSCVHLMLESPDHSVSNGRAHHAFNLLLGLPTLFVMRIQMIHFLYTYFYTTTKEQKYDKQFLVELVNHEYLVSSNFCLSVVAISFNFPNKNGFKRPISKQDGSLRIVRCMLNVHRHKKGFHCMHRDIIDVKEKLMFILTILNDVFI